MPDFERNIFLRIVPSLQILLRFHWLLVVVSLYSSLSNAKVNSVSDEKLLITYPNFDWPNHFSAETE